MTALVTTLNKIRASGPCSSGWTKLLKHLNKTDADNEPLLFSVIVESNGLDDALWCCEFAPEYAKEWRLFAVWCARSVSYLMTDARSLAAIEIAEKFAHGNATEEELAAAHAAARGAARGAARAAAGIGAGDAARDAAWAVAGVGAGDAKKTEFLRIVSGEPLQPAD